MIGQILVTALLLAMFVYGVLEYKRSPVIGLLIALFTLAAGIFVWQPRMANAVATALQLGSRDDLILYAWVAIFFLVLINLHLKSRLQMRVTTALARQIAITNARTPVDADLLERDGPPSESK